MRTLLVLGILATAVYLSPIGRYLRSRTPMDAVTAAEAATRLAESQKPTVILLYGTGCPISKQMFAAFTSFAERAKAAGAEVLAYSTDETVDTQYIRPFLARRQSTLAPRWIRPWQPGELDRAFRPLGIHVGQEWVRPLLAVRAADGRIVYQAQAARDIPTAERALQHALKATR